ncbi:class I SAM-dependent methyltransferase [Lutibaculum baratangense]|uniref:Uncharacterized protein n=1 Tax=Lutibaculum baratangense AMV1 TaxID=631454 RepID=V4RIC5_9HYPH|nr:class I SAM-dependent methyltransferase [Lutibaculum baratangense]ESR23030.1 hypothetical protein N177_3098 [Lutibaculum baratangense AMV1]
MNIHTTASLDEGRLNALMGTVLNEIGAAHNATLVIIGEKVGLYRALAESREPLSAAGLAARTGAYERYVREWACAQAASGFVGYDETTDRFFMTPEQVAVFADEESSTYLAGGFQALSAVYAGEPRLAAAFTTGEGVGWGEHCNCLFCGTERFFRPGYKGHLVAEWLPALDGVTEKLERGIRVADIGCGHGASTAIMAEAFPNSEFVGYDFHEPSILEAGAKYRAPNLRFEVARAQDFPGTGFDLVAIFDALHDMGDPLGAVSHIRAALSEDGTLMVVEPKAGDRLADNLNPVGRVFYAASTNVCVPASLGQDGRAALGAQAGPARLGALLRDGGFSRVRTAIATPFNMVLEARP